MLFYKGVVRVTKVKSSIAKKVNPRVVPVVYVDDHDFSQNTKEGKAVIRELKAKTGLEMEVCKFKDHVKGLNENYAKCSVELFSKSSFVTIPELFVITERLISSTEGKFELFTVKLVEANEHVARDSVFVKWLINNDKSDLKKTVKKFIDFKVQLDILVSNYAEEKKKEIVRRAWTKSIATSI